MDPNLSLNQAPVLPQPDQLPINGSSVNGTPDPTTAGNKKVDGATTGVDASQGALAATGINPLIVDGNVQSAVSISGVAGMGMSASDILGAPPTMDSQSTISGLGNTADSLDQISSLLKDASDGAATTSTNTTVSTEAPPPAPSSNATTQTQAVTAPPPEASFSFTTLMNEIGALLNGNNQLLATQQTAQIDAIGAQAEATMSQADHLSQGANAQMAMAYAGMGVSMGISAVSFTSTFSAAREGDAAEMESITEQQDALSSASQTSLNQTKIATNPDMKASPAKAQESIDSMRTSAKTLEKKGVITPEQKASYDNQADASEAALKNAQYQKGGAKENETYVGSPDHEQAKADAKNAGQTEDSVDTPEKATAFYNSKAAKASTNAATPTQGKLFVNKRSSAWQGAYKSHQEAAHIYTGAAMTVPNVLNTSGQTQMTIDQSKGTQDSAAAQVQGATAQAMSQGANQTLEISNQLRSNMTGMATAMQSIVSNIHV